MKIINLVKSEFIKNYSIKKLIIISIIMLIVSIGFVEIYNKFYEKGPWWFNTFKKEIEELENKTNRTLEEEYNLSDYKLKSKLYTYLVSVNVKGNDYKVELARELMELYSENTSIKILKDNYNDPTIRQICNTSTFMFESMFQGTINHLCNAYKIEELDVLYLENEEKIKDYSDILKSNKYYLYVEYLKEKGLISDDERLMADLIISNKVESGYHYLSLNLKQYRQLGSKVDYEFIKEEDFDASDYNYTIPTYQDYIRYYTYLKEEAINKRNIILYSQNNSIPHDLAFNNDDWIDSNDIYLNTKSSVNLAFHFSTIVMLLVSITSGNIISGEHNKGTIKSIISAPVRRWKILASKFIYLILHTYIIWVIGLFFLSLYSGIKYGFGDLITPKLLYINNNVVEVNYYLFLFKDLFVASIPVICFLGILFFLSTITLSTSITVGVTSVLAILTPIYWFLCSNLKCKFLIYTPFLFFDVGFIHGKYEPYTTVLKQIDISYGRGIIISVLVTLFLYIMTNIVYIKRDIKN